MDFQYLCSETLKSHNRVVGVRVISGLTTIAHVRRKGVPAPKQSELDKMFMQDAMMVRFATTNEAMYGRIESIVITHEKLSAFIIPIDEEHFLVLGCAMPCNPKIIMDNVKRIMAEAKP